MCYVRVILATLSCNLMLNVCRADDVPQERNIVRPTTLSYNNADEDAERIIMAHDLQIDVLIRILASKHEDANGRRHDARRIAAAVALGRLRAEEAVDVLVANIGTIRSRFRLDNDFASPSPCADALVRIGRAGSRACIMALAKEEDDHRRNLMIRVIRRVETEEVAGFMLRRTIADESDSDRKARLRSALDKL